MNELQKWTAGIAGAILIGVSAVWILTASDLRYHQTFDPRYEAARSAAFTHSAAYTEGMIQNLEHERIEYARTKDADARAAIVSTVLHDYAAYDESTLPPDLRKFVDDLKAGK